MCSNNDDALMKFPDNYDRATRAIAAIHDT